MRAFTTSFRHFWLRILFLGCIGLLGAGPVAPLSVAQSPDASLIGTGSSNQAKRHIRRGDRLYTQGGARVMQAIEPYKMALMYEPSDAMLHFKIGECYLCSLYPDSALKYLDSARELGVAEKRVYFSLAETHQLRHEFEQALEYLSIFRQSLNAQELISWNDQINKKLNECQAGIGFLQRPQRVFIDFMPPGINSSYDDYNPLLLTGGDSLFFTSRRPAPGRSRRDQLDHKYHEHILLARKTTQGWAVDPLPPKTFTTRSHTATSGITYDGLRIIVYRGSKGGNLSLSQYQSGKWTRPREIPKINSRHQETSAALSSDGKTLYFISERPGGYGGKDVWVSTLDRKNKWTEPVNLGPVINTPYDEEGLFLSPDGQSLYFSSKGHNSMGGYDIFRSYFENGRWSSPVNLGYPINSAADDVFFSLSADPAVAYFSSKRPYESASGNSNIYRITFLGPEKQLIDQLAANEIAGLSRLSPDELLDTELVQINQLTLLMGKVLDEETLEPLQSVITLYDNETEEVLASFQTNEEDGAFFISLPSGKNYGLAVDAEDYLFYSANINISQSNVYREIIRDILMKKIAVGQSIVLNNIFFDFDRATLRPESYAELGILYKLLEDNPDLRIEISGHTDNVGSASYNQKLSAQRARAVVNYLIERGIETMRLEYKGFGFSRPIAPNDTEEGRQLNRRTEFEIIEN